MVWNIPKRMGKGWKLSPTFKTNGYELHFVFENNVERYTEEDKKSNPKVPLNKRKRVGYAKKMEEQDYEPRYEYKSTDRIDSTDARNFGGLDPGNNFPFVWCTLDENGNFQVYSISKKQWHKASGKSLIQKRMERIRQKHPELHEIEAQIGSLHTGYLGRLLRAIIPRIQNFARCFQIWSQKHFLRAKAASRIKFNKARDNFLEKLTAKNTKSIGWGDGSRLNNIPGCSQGAPHAKIRRHAVRKGYSITFVDEYRTSITSCCCWARVEHPRLPNPVDPEHPNNWRNFDRSISICTACGLHIPRDINAAHNIFDIYWCKVNGLVRPEVFQRQ